MIYNITDADYNIDESAVERLYEDFKEVSQVAPPKILTLGEAMDIGLVPEKDVNPTIDYAKKLLKYSGREPVSKTNFGEKMRNDKDNAMFHAVKCMFLIHQHKTHGYYSYPQAHLHDKFGDTKWEVHPGQFRVKALIHNGAWEQKFIVWDSKGLFGAPEIGFEEWFDMFKGNAEHKRDLHIAKFNDDKKKIIEFHVGEDRDDMYNLCSKVHRRFEGKLPYLVKGNIQPHLEEFFGDDPTSKIHVTSERMITEPDLKLFLELHPLCSEIRADNLTISVK
tara:strand:- start:17391 stop:18224 length:834 start_codon:yes stop_codon:yes gene_type:complete